MHSNIGKVFIVSGAILLAGCAGFQENKLRAIPDSEYVVNNAKKVKVFNRWKVEGAGSLINKDAAAALYKKSFEKALTESGCCDIVEGPTEATLVIDGTAIDHSNAAALVPAVITGLSLYTIPSWVTQEIDIRVDATSGTMKDKYQVNDSFTLVQWLPMMFAFPFTGGPVQNTEDLNSRTYKNLIVQLKNSGYL